MASSFDHKGGAYFQRVMAHHSVPREAGAIFARTRPRLAVYLRIVRPSSDQMPPGPIEPLIAETREEYDEPLVLFQELRSRLARKSSHMFSKASGQAG